MNLVLLPGGAPGCAALSQNHRPISRVRAGRFFEKQVFEKQALERQDFEEQESLELDCSGTQFDFLGLELPLVESCSLILAAIQPRPVPAFRAGW
ncbi:MAG: hypothetical protein WAM78_09155 [Candidatus Sulfotelmatobacter sp.]